MKIVKMIGWGLLAVFLLIQLPFFAPDKNYSETGPTQDIAQVYEVPMDVLMHLNNACYDCHSNYTEEYPWYNQIQPVSWWLGKHIREGKEAVNFSEFGNYSKTEAVEIFENIQEVMEDHSMPLKPYVKMHKKAQLSDSDYESVVEWSQKMQQELKAQ